MEGDAGGVEEELVASTPEPRNWKGLFISILVIALIILLVALSVVWMTPEDAGPRVRGERIRLDTILDGKFKPNAFNVTWFKGSQLAYTNPYGGLSVFDLATRRVTELLDNSTFRMLNSVQFSLSPSLSHVMVVHDSTRVFRHSTAAKYTIQSINNSTLPLRKVGTSSSQNSSPSQEVLQHAEFVPGGGVVFVKENNIYYMPEKGNRKVVQLTTSGSRGTIYNGVADWLYEEEILGQSSALWVSTDGARLAYAVFNDTLVEQVVLREYGGSWESGAPVTDTRSQQKVFRYPRAGGENPMVSLEVTSLGGRKGDTVTVTPPQELRQQEHYLCDVQWLHSGELAVLWMNRLQNTSYHTLCRSPDYSCKQIHVERMSERGGKGWLENRGLPVFSKSGDEMVLVEPIRDGTAGHWPQILHSRVSTSQTIPSSQLTQGRFEVTEILGWDQRGGALYYMATLAGRPGSRHLFSLATGSRGTEPHCLTCLASQGYKQGVSSGSLLPCSYSEVRLDPAFNAYVQHCLGPDIPSSHVFSLPDNTLIWTLDTNTRLQKQVALSSMPTYKQLSIPIPGTPHRARVKLTLPPVLREDEDFQFPLVVNIYGGPGTQSVSDKWAVGWDTYLASQRNFIVASVDVRGSGFQGEEYKHAVYRQLGSVEVTDTLHVIRELVSSLQYIDSSRACVWGWSYGGYLTGLVLAEDGRTAGEGGIRSLQCGIAVAPVTQWHYYDSAYTERFMGVPTPEGNWKGYTQSSLVGRADYIQDSSLMVVHGTADDNVHVEHSMMLAKALVAHNIIFRQQIYPDESHSLHGVIKHEHHTMEAFLDDTFGHIEDFFLNDYYRAAAELLEEVETAR